MASSYSDLGIELMVTGENAGTWGTKTNANLQLIEQLMGGFLEVSIAGGAQTTALDIDDGALTGKAQQRVLKLTGTITGNQIVTFPLLTENFYVIENATSGAYTVQLKAASGSGATVTYATDDKGYKFIFLDGVATNTGVFEASFSTAGTVTETGTQTLTNKTLTSPKIGTSILDTNGNELFKLTATGSAVNELTYANAATGNKPTLTASGGDTNIGVSIQPKGSGTVTIDALTFPAADGSADQVLATDGSGTLSFTDMGGGSVSWQTGAIKTTGFTAVAGEGYFCNTTGGAFTVTLPSGPSAGAIVAIKDYAGTFVDNNITVGRNSSNIDGVAQDGILDENNLAVSFIYIDGTQGWKAINSDAGTYGPGYVIAEGGDITICGDFKIHTFNSPGIFSVSRAGNPSGSTDVDYMVLAGGGNGGPNSQAGGGGAGGFRESHSTPVSGSYTASPLATPTAVTVTAQNYPVVIGAGASGKDQVGYDGAPSSALGITSAGGGNGGYGGASGGPGGSGGGGGENASGGSGNVPSVSPPQGNPGGSSGSPSGAGGGGAGGTGANSSPQNGGNGGSGVTTSITGVAQSFAGGGGGGGYSPSGSGGSGPDGAGQGGDYNNENRFGFDAEMSRGGGGGGNGWPCPGPGGFGGSGKVVIRYKYR
tara:strand:- start:1301 stop:3259 length:1959 start_codon:yes stop_codon:yes gene_type:complete